jgi:hypothetical protein
MYPWGDDLPSPQRANCGKNKWDKNMALVSVGTTEDGKSPYGTMIWQRMPGNGSATYMAMFITKSPSQNPKGPEHDDYKVMRGSGEVSGTFISAADNSS